MRNVWQARENIQKASESVLKDMAVFKETEGWGKLSPAQQMLIRASLIVTERAKRGQEEENDINSDPFFKVLIRLSSQMDVAKHVMSQQIRRINKHAASKKHVDDYYCNISAYVLEDIERLREESERLKKSGVTTPGIPRELPPEDMAPEADFFSGTRIDTPALSDLEAMFADGGFPYVCNIQAAYHDEGAGWSGSEHTFVALGKSEDDIVVWEKVARRQPHQRSTLRAVLKEYPLDRCNFYVRPMKRAESNDA